MSSFSLVYVEDAEDQLAWAWLNADDPPSVTLAQSQIDKLLSRNPKDHGEDIGEGLWRLIVAPLVAYYEIDDAQHVVTVTRIALLGQAQEDS